MNKLILVLRLTFAIGVLLVALLLTACSSAVESSQAVQAEAVDTAVPEAIEQPTAEPAEAPTAEPVVSDSSETVSEMVEVVASFDASLMEFPEGIAIDKDENIYVSLGLPFWLPDVDYFGEIRKISPDGTETVLAEIDGPAAAGMAVHPSGALYYAYPTADENTRGVYRLMEDSEPERLPGTEGIILANGVAIDEKGDVYISDSILGAIWRIPGGQPAAEIWMQHEWLAGCPEDPIGANGIAFSGDSLYVASTVKGLLVNIPIEADGSVGEPKLIAGKDDCEAEFDELDSMDGIALDVDGNIYAFLVIQNQLVRIDPSSGAIEQLLTGDDGLHNPASLAFGSGMNNIESVFFTNFAVLPPAPSSSLGPSVLKVDVGVPGLPLP